MSQNIKSKEKFHPPEDIHVRFYEVKDGMIEWEAFGDFQASDVHKQVAISFKTPRYKTLEVNMIWVVFGIDVKQIEFEISTLEI